MFDENEEVARLEQLNERLKRSLRLCHAMVHDYEVRLAANFNAPIHSADEQESGEA